MKEGGIVLRRVAAGGVIAASILAGCSNKRESTLCDHLGDTSTITGDSVTSVAVPRTIVEDGGRKLDTESLTVLTTVQYNGNSVPESAGEIVDLDKSGDLGELLDSARQVSNPKRVSVTGRVVLYDGFPSSKECAVDVERFGLSRVGEQ